MAEKMKKGPSEAGRKTLKCPHKQGINLNMREQKGNPRLTLLVGCLAIVILAGCVAKFGVIDQYRRLDAAQAAYASVHTEYTQMQELLKGYDRLLMEYRTYSMEWATDGSEDNGTLVDRQKALDLLEQEMLSRGRLVSLQVSGNKMVVSMSGMFMVAGLLYGYDEPKNFEAKSEHYARIQELAGEYRVRNGSIVCREILGLGKGKDDPVPSRRTKEYYQKRPCPDLVAMAAAIMEEYIRENPLEG